MVRKFGRSCMLYACAKLSQGSRDFFYFREQNFRDWKATQNFPPRNFSAIRYIGILVTSTTTGHGGSVVSALVSQAKGRGSFSSRGITFFSHKYFTFHT